MASYVIFPDTNFLIECFANKIDIRTELDRICHFPYKLFIVNKTFAELERLTQTAKTRTAAKLAITFAKTLPIHPSAHPERLLDDDLAELSGENIIIATQDKELKKRLHGPYVIIRQAKYLTLEKFPM